jgi:methylated-DNA-[protein]-cysteine S-methyltransferase
VAADLMERCTATTVETPLGPLAIVRSVAGIVATAFEDGTAGADRELDAVERALGASIGPMAARDADALRREVDRYFDGDPRSLGSPVDLRLVGPGFHRRVLEITMAIPFGELRTYGDVADAAGSPRGGRAAGSALARCPIELWVPCHRVVHADGHIGGYGRHEDRKRFLVRHEGLEPRAPAGRRGRRDVPGGRARD